MIDHSKPRIKYPSRLIQNHGHLHSVGFQVEDLSFTSAGVNPYPIAFSVQDGLVDRILPGSSLGGGPRHDGVLDDRRAKNGAHCHPQAHHGNENIPGNNYGSAPVRERGIHSSASLPTTREAPTTLPLQSPHIRERRPYRPALVTRGDYKPHPSPLHEEAPMQDTPMRPAIQEQNPYLVDQTRGVKHPDILTPGKTLGKTTTTSRAVKNLVKSNGSQYSTMPIPQSDITRHPDILQPGRGPPPPLKPNHRQFDRHV